MVSSLLLCGFLGLSVNPPPDSAYRVRRVAARFAFGSDVQLMQGTLPVSVGGRYMGIARKGGDYLIGQLSFQLTKRLFVLGQLEMISIYGGSLAFLFDDNYQTGGPRIVYALPDYPNYHVENAINEYTNYSSYRRTMLAGLGYDLLLKKHWNVRVAGLGGINVLKSLDQSMVIKEKGSNYTQLVSYVPVQRMGYTANAELMLGYRWRVGRRQEMRFSFDHSLTYNRLSVDYAVQTVDLMGKSSQVRTHEPFPLWLRRVGFGIQYGF